ncbi:alcohol oxidase [Violaceomyces palustris]|uniref:Alcohol oxidase n=1 Tax=Violaceomyces palustris TaxID=1673888 RepID=A0ACD0P1Q5_9BASI|nr:alcohol oxidase [Violaceomyces palustris]
MKLIIPTVVLTLASSFAGATPTPLANSPVVPAPLNGEYPNLPDPLTPLLSNNTYDYVVVGAGTAGMTLAYRLAQDPNVKVAVLEAGIDYTSNLVNQALVEIPGADTIGCGASETDFLNNMIDWGYVTAPQTGAGNRQVRYARGKCLGGSSARVGAFNMMGASTYPSPFFPPPLPLLPSSHLCNFMLYQRPTKGSMQKWVDLTGDPQWNFDARFQDFKKSVKFTPPKSNLRQDSPSAQYSAASFDPASTGPLQVSFPNFAQPFSKFVQLGLNEVGIATTQDFNGGSVNGVQYCPLTVNPQGGGRSTSRSFFAAGQQLPNLKVFNEALAKRIIIDAPSNGGKPIAKGVRFTQFSLQTLDVYATKEVIVSAGAFGSPQLLMVSGIGPKDQLERFNIKTIVEAPGVGQNMLDHVFAAPSYPVNVDTPTRLVNDPVYLAAQTANFTINQLGPLTSNTADLLAFERWSDSDLSRIGAGILTTYPKDWPTVEYFSAAGYIGDFSNLAAENMRVGADGTQFGSILLALVSPRSKGTVTLASADTKDLPIIDPRWLTDPVDQKVAIEGFKRTRKVFASRAMQPVLTGPEFYPGSKVQSDADILKWYQNNLLTVWHAACTVRMGKKEDGAVLDSNLRVYGVDSLRVVDASSFPDLPPGHPQSVIYMLAERAADLIKAAHT